MANMWYDKFAGSPPHGSPLETILVLVQLERRQAQLLETRALLQAIVGLHESAKTQDPAISAYQEYCDKMFPFLNRAMDREQETAIERLRKLVDQPVKINRKDIEKARAEFAKQKALMKAFRAVPRSPGLTHDLEPGTSGLRSKK